MRLVACLFTIVTFISCSSISTKEVEYKVGKQVHNGYLASGANEGERRPAVIVVHEWWGHNDFVRQRAEALAELGYTALALDMYGDGKTVDHPKDAMKFAKKAFSNPKLLKEKFQAGYDLLKKQEGVDPARIGAVGYCFGGAIVLLNATQGSDIKGAVSFHGSLGGIKTVKKGSTTKLLVINGADDPLVTSDDIKNFKKVIGESQLSLEFVNIPGAKHAFTNPEATEKGEKFNLPLEYNEKADKESWALMREFLQNKL